MHWAVQSKIFYFIPPLLDAIVNSKHLYNSGVPNNSFGYGINGKGRWNDSDDDIFDDNRRNFDVIEWEVAL